jgi:hypothetical protein
MPQPVTTSPAAMNVTLVDAIVFLPIMVMLLPLGPVK